MTSPTFRQRRNRDAYLSAHCDAIHAAEREREVREWVKENDVPAPITLRQLVLMAAAWVSMMLGALWFCTDAGMAFLDALWSLK